MKEIPILFKGEMVRAIQSGEKTQTRKIIKPQPEFEGVKSFGGYWRWRSGDDWFSGVTTEQLTSDKGLLYPTRAKYKVGDKIWVKETFAPVGRQDGSLGSHIRYKADETKAIGAYGAQRWDPSIFMRREYSRINLEITDVRVERVADISEEDAKAEGVEVVTDPHWEGSIFYKNYIYPHSNQTIKAFGDAKRSFESLWDSINGRPSPIRDADKKITHYVSFPFSGESRTETFRGKPHIITCSPWVWCISFKKI